MTKEICVTKETMIDYYNGKRSEKKSIGDQVEDFIALFRVSIFLKTIHWIGSSITVQIWSPLLE